MIEELIKKFKQKELVNDICFRDTIRLLREANVAYKKELTEHLLSNRKCDQKDCKFSEPKEGYKTCLRCGEVEPVDLENTNLTKK